MTTATLSGDALVRFAFDDGSAVLLPWPLPDPLPTLRDEQAAAIAAWVTGGEEPAAAFTLAQLQAAALAEIDRQAEAARLKWLTPGAGQAQEYARTEAEADAAIAAGATGFAGYPMLKAERDAVVLAAGGDAADPLQGPTVQEVAAEVAAQRDAWLAPGAAIKAERRRAKLAVAALPDEPGSPAAVAATLAGLAWPSPA